MAEKIQVAIPATIQSKFNITLTENGFQALANRATNLVFNEDNLDEIKKYLADVRKLEIAIESTHKAGKEPSLIESRNWDLAKNTFLSQAAFVKVDVQVKYTVLCQEVARKQADQEQERQRVKNIKDGIEGNAVMFANKIANAVTAKELTSIESLINLEKTREGKYMEFLPDAATRFSQLNSILKEQKAKVAKLEELEAAAKAAQESGDDQALIDLAGKKEEIVQSIDESKILVQEKAVEQSMIDSIEVAQLVYPTVKAKRSTWKWEMKDVNLAQKKMPSFVKIVPNDEMIDSFLAAKKIEGIQGEEFTVAGVRFWLDKTY